MEYLMTYGWAILVIAVVLGALYSLGLFNSSALGPRASPGACQVYRPNGPGTTQYINLEGTCTGLLPKYVLQAGPSTSYRLQGATTPLSRLGFNYTVSEWFMLRYQTAAFTGGWLNSANPVVDIYNSSGNFDFGSGWAGGTTKQFTWEIAYPLTANCQTPAGSIQTNTWYNVVATAAGYNTINVYVNGVLMASCAQSANLNTVTSNSQSLDFAIGTNPPGTAEVANLTLITNVQLYNTTLDPASVNAIYARGRGGVPISLQNLLGWWPLNSNANDYSGNLYNMPTTQYVTYVSGG